MWILAGLVQGSGRSEQGVSVPKEVPPSPPPLPLAPPHSQRPWPAVKTGLGSTKGSFIPGLPHIAGRN